jgi:hypothetical protein
LSYASQVRTDPVATRGAAHECQRRMSGASIEHRQVRR